MQGCIAANCLGVQVCAVEVDAETEDVENETEAASDEDTLSALWNR